MENLKMLSDDLLVQLYSKGEDSAFEILLMRHKSRVYNYIYSIVKDNDLSDDIFQETFIKAVTNIRKGKYTESGRFVSWVMRMAHNLVIDHYRKQSYEQNVSVSDSDEYDILNNIKLSDGSIEDEWIAEQNINDVVALLDYLPDTQREIVRMRFYEDLSFKEISTKCDISINTALGRMRYALINLRKMAEERKISYNI